MGVFTQDYRLVQQIRSEAANATITAQRLRGNITLLTGSGGNIAVLPGPDGKLIVDAGIPAAKTRMTDALANVSADPVKCLVNTHWHFDHTDGNEWLHSLGATIIAHENTRKHLAMDTRVEDWDFTFPASPEGALPSEVFADERTLHWNGMNIVLSHYAPAHTDSDISVHFTDVDVLHVADTWWNGVYPFIDYSTGGSLDGTIRAAELNLAKAGPETIIIPGHGPAGDKTQLARFADLLKVMREKVSALKKQGMSLEEVIAARPTSAYDAEWGSLVPPSLFAILVYEGV